jgi:hypothetical protein
MSAAFTGADPAAVEAYLAAVEAVVRFQASADELQVRLDRCTEFAVGQAYAAFIASLTGATADAAHHARLARSSRSGITRRERQLVEILLSSVDGDHRRATALATEHVSEFPNDALPLSIIDRWSQHRQAS